jgi:hypothetical protein
MDCLQAFDFQAELKRRSAASAATTRCPTGLMERIAFCFNDDFDGAGDGG